MNETPLNQEYFNFIQIGNVIYLEKGLVVVTETNTFFNNIPIPYLSRKKRPTHLYKYNPLINTFDIVYTVEQE